MKILLVEDSATLRYTMSTFIKAAGHEAVVAESGEQALQLVENTQVDMVIMDVEMPGLNGFETTRLLRETFGKHWVPIIFVTGMSDDASFTEGIEAGGDDYMAKPVTPIILKAKIRALERIQSMQQEMRRLNKELKALSQRDSLTNLYNRRAFEDLGSKQWQIQTRSHGPISVLMIDIDHFKQYNDHYGHQEGDTCLQKVSRILAATLNRPADILARYGGEEFIALLPDTNLKGARVIAEKLRLAIESMSISHEKSPGNKVISISIGGSAAEHLSGIQLNQLIKQADKSLYESKNNGRNRATIEQVIPHKTILIVDENTDNIHEFSGRLSEHCNILTADSPTECIEIAHNIHPDLILFGLDDNELKESTDDLKNNSRTKKIPIIFCTENASQINAKDVFDLNIDGILDKEIEEKELLNVINRFIHD
ncbi:MAG: diguanylate cyclase [Cellvibrionaceae bacterium]